MPELLALIAESPDDKWAAETASVTVALVRAVLERGGRLLVHADTTLLFPLFMAAVPYRSEAVVETSERRPAPLVLALMRSRKEYQWLEECMFARFQEGSEHEKDRKVISWFEQIVEQGIVDDRWTTAKKPSIATVFREERPSAIVCVGGNENMNEGLEAAESYAKEAKAGLLLVPDIPSKASDRHIWKRLESILDRDWTPPHSLLGEEDDIKERPPANEMFEEIIRVARREAKLALMLEAAAIGWFRPGQTTGQR